MKNTQTAASTRPAAKLSTEVAATWLAVKPQTMRAGFCRHGHYMNMVPVKLPNGRLLWDAAAVERLTSGEVA